MELWALWELDCLKADPFVISRRAGPGLRFYCLCAAASISLRPELLYGCTQSGEKVECVPVEASA